MAVYLYDVFLSHVFKDKAIVRELAVRLRDDGFKVWFDEWEIQPGDSIPAKIEEGLEQSRILVLCMSENAFGSDWSSLESYSFRFRDPLNKERRFIPLRLDLAPIKDSLAQYKYISWLPEDRAQAYQKFKETCKISNIVTRQGADLPQDGLQIKTFSLGHSGAIYSVAFSPDDKFFLSGSADNTIQVWELKTGYCVLVLEGHTDSVWSAVWSPDGKYIITGSLDTTLGCWDVKTGLCIQKFVGHSAPVRSVSLSPDGKYVVSGSSDMTIRIWDVATGECLLVLNINSGSVLKVSWSYDGEYILACSEYRKVHIYCGPKGYFLDNLEGHQRGVRCIAWSHNSRYILTGSLDKTLLIWDMKSRRYCQTLYGHTDAVLSVAWSYDSQYIVSGSVDNTIRLWEVATGNLLQTLVGHNDKVWDVAWSHDGQFILSGSADKTFRIWEVTTGLCLHVLKGHKGEITSVAWNSNGNYVLSGSEDKTLRLWEGETLQSLRIFDGHQKRVLCVAYNQDGQYALSGSADCTIRLWEVATGHCLRVFAEHRDDVRSVAWSNDGLFALSVSADRTMRLWAIKTGLCLRVFKFSKIDTITSVAWSYKGKYAVSGSSDNKLRIWSIETGHCLNILEGHINDERNDSFSYNGIFSVTWSYDDRYIISGGSDRSVRLWDAISGICLRVFEGHSDRVWSTAWSNDNRFVVSGSEDSTVRIWELETGHCLCVLEGHVGRIHSIAWGKGEHYVVYSATLNGVWRIWDISEYLTDVKISESTVTAHVQYTNAKVLLVGDSGVGKTGLANRLAENRFEETASTDGAWATQWILPNEVDQDGVEREIWLWDFAGQVDYRLVHQLFMDDTAAAVLVFNPQQENPFEGLGQWDRDLQKATRKSFAKLLAAGRIDRGGLMISNNSIDKFIQERSFRKPIHLTSAKTGEGCNELRSAIINSIDWKDYPITTSPLLYQRMKQEIIHLRDSGLVLIRLAELKQRMELALTGEQFTPNELLTVIKLLEGPGMILRVDFGGFILLQPEVLSRYAAALVRKVRKHPQELGCIREDELLAGELDYQEFERLPLEDESVVLRVLHETIVKRAWCLRQPCDGTALLTFPSYFRRERPELQQHPQVLVTYRFTGPVEEIYATLVVRLHHTTAFDTDQLWKFAADFKTQTEQCLGFKLTREAEGSVRLEVYFHPDVDENSRLIFLRYVHDHLTGYAQDVVRLRHYFCNNKKCEDFQHPFTDRDKIDKMLAAGGKGKVYCPGCGKPIQLRDIMEEKFESSAVIEEARKLQEESKLVIDNESMELILVGHAFTITAEAGQIYRGYTNSDHGIDGEIEFKDNEGRATGKRLYLQLKSGDAYLTKRKRDGAEIFQIKKDRWVHYWQQQAYPVMLVIRTSDGEIRWMDVTDYLKHASDNGRNPVTQILFDGERFDVMSIRSWRDKLCS